MQHGAHQRLAVHGQADRAAHPRVRERRRVHPRLQVVDRQAAGRAHRAARRRLHPVGEPRRQLGDEVRPPGDQPLDALRRVALEADAHPRLGRVAQRPAAAERRELDAAARLVGDEAVRTGAHRLRDQPRRVAGHDGDEGQLVEQDRVRPAGLHLDRERRDGARHRHLDQVARHLAPRVRARALEAHHHVRRPQRPAVVETDARAQPEPPGEIVGVVPTRRQRRAHVHVDVEGDQRVIDVVQHPVRGELVVQMRIEPLRATVEHQPERRRATAGPTRAGNASPDRGGERQPCHQAPGVPPRHQHPAASCFRAPSVHPRRLEGIPAASGPPAPASLPPASGVAGQVPQPPFATLWARSST